MSEIRIIEIYFQWDLRNIGWVCVISWDLSSFIKLSWYVPKDWEGWNNEQSPYLQLPGNTIQKILELLKVIVYHFTYEIHFVFSETNQQYLNDLCKWKYLLFDFFSPALASHRHANDYLSKSHCLLTRYEGFLDTIMTALDSLDNI